MTTESIEGFKEFGRTVLLFIVSYLLTAGVLNKLLPIILGRPLSPDESFLLITFLTALLKAVDKWLHKHGKKVKNPFFIKGLTRF